MTRVTFTFFTIEMSPGDILRLKRMYQCSETEVPGRVIGKMMMKTPTTNYDEEDDENDMVLTKKQFDSLYSLSSVKRNGLASEINRWPGGVLQYHIDPTAFSEFKQMRITFQSHCTLHIWNQNYCSLFRLNFIRLIACSAPFVTMNYACRLVNWWWFHCSIQIAISHIYTNPIQVPTTSQQFTRPWST